MKTKKKVVKKAAVKKIQTDKKTAKKKIVKKAVKKVTKKKAVKKAEKITKDMSIAEVVRKYPQTIEVFFNYELHCIGCAAADFDTVESGARVHGVNVEHLLFDLNKMVK